MTALVLVALLAAEAVTAPARIVNARVETRAAPAGLTGIVRELSAPARGPLWIGYAVASNEHGTMCCFDSLRSVGRCSGCRLEGGGAFFTDERSPAREGPVELEGSRQVLMLYRLARGRVERVRAFSAECALDAGGLTLVWLTHVASAESLALLRTLVDQLDGDDDAPLAAIAQHAEPGASNTLIEIARHGRTPEVQKQAFFWLAESDGPRATAFFEEVLGR